MTTFPSDFRPNEKAGAEKKSCEPALPAADCDVLYGVGTIARWLGMTRGQAKPLIDDGTIPTFRPPGHTARCALKSEINAAFREHADRH
jgi:hypothetical protein